MFKFFRSDKAIGGIATAYVAGMVMMLAIAVLVGGVNRPKFLSSSAAGNVRYIGPAICDPANTSPRCRLGSALTIKTPSVLPGGVQNRPYAYQFVASGGVPPYTWETTTQSSINWYHCCLIVLHPNGLFASVTGVDGSSMPNAGEFQVGVRVTDANGRFTEGVFSYTIEPDGAIKDTVSNGQNPGRASR